MDHDLDSGDGINSPAPSSTGLRPGNGRLHCGWADAEVIHTYTRAQAIEDGELVDVSETGREAGFRWPVALTRAVWADAVEWDDSNAALQDESGRLWDALWMAAHAAKRAPERTDRIAFEVLRIPNTPKATKARLCWLVSHIGPGDTPEPVITILLPNES